MRASECGPATSPARPREISCSSSRHTMPAERRPSPAGWLLGLPPRNVMLNHHRLWWNSGGEASRLHWSNFVHRSGFRGDDR